jgi:hypothetical protein
MIRALRTSPSQISHTLVVSDSLEERALRRRKSLSMMMLLITDQGESVPGDIGGPGCPGNRGFSAKRLVWCLFIIK